MITGSFNFFKLQTGFIQIGDERMLIEPVNNTLSEFSGMEHNVFRQKRSPQSNQQNSKAHQESCKTVAGKGQEHLITIGYRACKGIRGGS